ncbi:MAG: pyrroline-5-carboxylate reductase [Firmicutes bacterium]|nr:pyrroline-5-carboxylate reductase [Bacillota bacterium]
MKNVGFIGAGNMGGAILRGALGAGVLDKKTTYVCGRDKEKAERTAAELGINACGSAAEIAVNCRYIVLGVKPKDIENIAEQVRDAVSPAQLKEKVVISMAAGVKIAAIEAVLGSDAKIVRIMPNTPAKVCAGMTSVSRNGNVTDGEMNEVMSLFSSIGMAADVPEDMIHTVIGVSGSSPAYTYLYIDALIEEAVAEGMDRAQARIFAAQAVLGAAKMVLETEEAPQQLCENVCSPGGTTIEAVKMLKTSDFEGIIRKSFRACTDKSKIMSGENSKIDTFLGKE